MANDHFAYVNIFRKAIDEVEECKKQNWLIIMDPKTEHSIRVQALKELHRLSKTYALIVKDLPFVTLLTKYYDRNLLFSNYNGATDSKRTFSNNNNNNNQSLKKNLPNEQYCNKLENKDNKIGFNDSMEENTITNKDILTVEKSSNQYKDVDEEMIEELARQGHMPDIIKGKKYEEITQEDWDKIVTPEYKESIRKVKELLDE